MRINEPILEVKNLSTYFIYRDRTVKAVDDVSFRVNTGEIFAIAGESGAGKSVIALSILRLVPQPGKIMHGEILYRGQDLVKMNEAELRNIRGGRISMIFQNPMTSLDPVFTIGEQKSAWGRAIEMLQMVNMPDAERRADAYPHELSGGMQQRTMIAIGLSCAPDLIIADNPTTALDVTIQMQFLSLCRQIRSELGTAFVYITHDLGVVAKLCDRVAVMYAGRIVEEGETVQVLTKAAHPYTVGLIRAVPKLGDRRSRLVPIEGKQPDLSLLPPGCPFAPRCFMAKEVCRVTEVPARTTEEGHYARCLFGEKGMEMSTESYQEFGHV
ncbi:MAG: ABC transporter ATP-binding protein [Deltaproteobacteria bacterium]|nr:ABC transporter ATP-binding protein [Deltaproteobacteria bacterium]